MLTASPSPSSSSMWCSGALSLPHLMLPHCFSILQPITLPLLSGMLILPGPGEGSGTGGHVTWNESYGGYYLDFRRVCRSCFGQQRLLFVCLMAVTSPQPTRGVTASATYARCNYQRRTVSVFFTNVALLITKLTKVMSAAAHHTVPHINPLHCAHNVPPCACVV
jgi:hypothetical protein